MSEDPTPYGRHDPVVALRLELGRERDRAEAFRNSLNTEVLKVMRVAVIQATIDADNEIARLKAEVERLKSLCDILGIGGRPAQEYVGHYPNPTNLVPIKPAGDDKKGDAS